MDEINEVHKHLLELAEEKKHAIIKNDVNKLNQIVNKESQYVRKVRDLDQQRAEAVNELLLSKCFRPDPKITTSDIIKLLYKSEEKKALSDAQKRLMQTLVQMKQVNDRNQQLIRQSLAFIDYSLDLVVGPIEEEATYHNPNQQAQGYKRNGYFDTRA